MKQLGFYYDPTVCIGCRACQVACKEEHKLPSGDFFRRAEAIQSNGKWQFFSGACNHCANAACLRVCPTGALYRAEDGTVQHRDDLCIGCGRCAHSCPYGAVSLSSITGYAQKCDGCAARRAAGKNPACVDACPVRALHFGPMEELKEAFGSCGAALPFLPDPVITDPNLLIGGTAEEEIPLSEVSSMSEIIPPSDSKAHIVILGSGAAALSAAKEIRSRAKDARITMISRETRLPYNRPMLSKGLLNSFDLSRYPIVDPAWLEANIDYMGGRTVTALDPEAHTVTLADGMTIAYDKCIYALGMDCFVPPIEGRDLPGVYTLRTDTDLHELRKAMLTAGHAVIIGGGITGLELAWEMKKAGLEVAVLDMLPQMLGRILDAHTAERLRRIIEAKDIIIDTGVQITAIEGRNCAQTVRLSDGRQYTADLVVLSTGYRAAAALAQSAGLTTDRGICTNEYLRTSHSDIYACGDCASGAPATWLAALDQGRIAGVNALGDTLTYVPLPEPALIHTADTSLLVVGDLGKDPNVGYTYAYLDCAQQNDLFRVHEPTTERSETHVTVCLKDGCTCGMALLGDLSAMAQAETAVQEGWSLETVQKAFGQKGE